MADRIDIIHMRDPDSACDIEVYVNGKSVEFELHEFDPGAGYSMDDFDEMRENAIANAPDALKERLASIYDSFEPTYRKWSYE